MLLLQNYFTLHYKSKDAKKKVYVIIGTLYVMNYEYSNDFVVIHVFFRLRNVLLV